MENYEYIQHSGIKGMRWGVRRYQNHDGSLTDAGRKRYGDGSDSSKPKMSFGEKRAAKKKAKEAEARKQARLEAMRKGKEAKQKAAEEEARKQAETEAKKQKVLESRSAKEIYENANLFTNEELNAAYQRLTLERNIANLSPREVSKGEQFVKGLVNTANTVSSVAEAGTKLYNHMARLHNSLGDSDDKWPIIKDNDQKKGGKKDKNKDKDNNQNNENRNEEKNSNQNKDKKSDKGGNKNSEQKQDARSEQNKTEKTKQSDKQTNTKNEKTETWEGTVEGTGTSKGSQSKSNTKSKSADYYDPIDGQGEWVNESVSNLPAVRNSSGQSRVNRYLDDYGGMLLEDFSRR